VKVFSFLMVWTAFLVFAPAGYAAADNSYFWNLNTGPLDWFVGPNARLDMHISDNWSLGPAIMYQNRMLMAVAVNELSPGLYVTYAFAKSQTHYWYVEAGALYGVLRAEYTDVHGAVDRVKVGNWTKRFLLGHQWNFGQFSISASAGQELNSAGHTQIYDSTGASVATIAIYPARAVFEFSFGFAF
jgi:hypothetical protein